MGAMHGIKTILYGQAGQFVPIPTSLFKAQQQDIGHDGLMVYMHGVIAYIYKQPSIVC